MQRERLNQIKHDLRDIQKEQFRQFLIENGSSPFYDEDDEDMDISFIPNPLICLKEYEDLKICSELDIRHFSSNSTQSEYRFEAQI